MILNTAYTLFNGIFADKRLDKRMSRMLKAMVTRESVVINRCFPLKTDKIGAYRMINNASWEVSDIIKRLQENCSSYSNSSHVLCIQDTTELNYTHLQGRLSEDDASIGPVTKSSNSGFFCHPTLVVDAASEIPLGFSCLKLWSRSRHAGTKHTRNYQYQSIADKESYRWIESALETRKILPSKVKTTIIGDRESDIYEALYQIPRSGCELLIRSSSNRKLSREDLCLLEKMQSLPCCHTYELKIKGNHSRKNRTALMELRYGSVLLSKPSSAEKDAPDSIKINCIYVVEKGDTTPSNESPVEWRLLTTHPVESVEDAMRCVEWYKLRWYIEELFRLLKSQGLGVESMQLETGSALQKMVALALVVALQIMTLKLGYDKEDEKTPVDVIFTPLQTELLKVLLGMTEGRTAKQKNPFKHGSLAWAAWIIARLGCWDGYASQGPPGYITFKRGMERFGMQWELFKVLNKDV